MVGSLRLDIPNEWAETRDEASVDLFENFEPRYNLFLVLNFYTWNG